MYWYRNIEQLGKSQLLMAFTFVAIMSTTSCSNHDSRAANKDTYYPIHAFFKKEVDSLKLANPIVSKTVGKGDERETKELHIKNWENEMGAFLSADLSKPAYDGMYTVDSSENSITYTAISPEVDISKVNIVFDTQGAVDSIEIVKTADNILYQNKERLIYNRGVSYSLTKNQDILLLGKNIYSIIGVLK